MNRVLRDLIYFLYDQYQKFFGYAVANLSSFIPMFPAVLRVRITTRCNLHCGFCYLSGSLNLKEENALQKDEWEKVLSKIPFYTLVDITGAEPTLSKDFDFILSYLLTKKRKVSLTTNGMNCSDQFVERIVKQKLTYLMVSIDDFPNEHNTVRGHQKSFSNIEELLIKVEKKKRELKSKFPIVNIKTTLLDSNMDHLEELCSFLKDRLNFNIQSVNLAFDNPARGGIVVGKSLDEILKLKNTFRYEGKNKEALIKVKNFFVRKKGDIKIRPEIKSTEVPSYIQNPGSFGVKHCNKYDSVITLNYDGSLSFCDINYKFSNIRDLDFDLSRAWSSRDYQVFRKKLKSQFPYASACEGCCLAKHTVK